jgi:hypothetical protein
MTQSWLESPATRADVIGWALMAPVLGWSCLQLPVVHGVAEDYADQLALSQRLGNSPQTSPIARLLVGIGGDGLVLIQLGLVLIPAIVLIRSRRP